MRRIAVNSAAWLAICVLGFSRSAAGGTPGPRTAEPAILPTVAIGQDFGVAPTETVTPADPYEAYSDPNDPPAGRHRPVVVQASAQEPVAAFQSVIKAPAVDTPTVPVSISQRFQGRVVVVDPSAGLVQIAFPVGREPRVGDIVKVTHSFLFGRDEVGKLRIVHVGRGVGLARPIGPQPFGGPIHGDMVDYWIRYRPSGSQMPMQPTLAAR
jgi:hypothetical protein